LLAQAEQLNACMRYVCSFCIFVFQTGHLQLNVECCSVVML
jgi:hypothetical protein